MHLCTTCSCCKVSHKTKQPWYHAGLFYSAAWVWERIEGYYTIINPGQLGRGPFRAECHAFSLSISVVRCCSAGGGALSRTLYTPCFPDKESPIIRRSLACLNPPFQMNSCLSPCDCERRSRLHKCRLWDILEQILTFHCSWILCSTLYNIQKSC